jgi:inner membrane protein
MATLVENATRGMKSPAFKFFLILFLIVLLLVPLAVVYALISDRETRARSVQTEVGRIWGPEQRVVGPFLIVPYQVRIALFTPEKLEIAGTADGKVLRRSIFDVPVYASRLKLTGRFAAPRLADLAADAISPRWKDASLVLGLTGVSGLKEEAILKIGGAPDIAFAPSLGLPSGPHGIHARLGPAFSASDKDPAAFTFAVDLVFNGSVSLDVAPAARETKVSLTSTWPHPSFTGAFLPDERTITPKGFTASWKIPHLARSVPESWILNDVANGSIERLAPYVFGVRLVPLVDSYSLVNRATKYGLMFLSLVFMAVFCLEILSGKAVHPVQYLFTGLALVFFFVLLLSLAEHIGFKSAYALAALSTGGMLATYIGAVLHNRRTGLIMLGVLLITYLLLYLILQLEDYALLAGALLGFVALTAVMFATLRVDWSGAGRAVAGNS